MLRCGDGASFERPLSALDLIYLNGRFVARFRKILYSRRHVTLCRADDADGRRCSRASQRAMEQAFANCVTV
jgi:hypothetical protein